MKIKKALRLIAEFQSATSQTVNHFPTLVKDNDSKLRYDLMREENIEYKTANDEKDLTEILDACIDMFYVLAGTINTHGLQDVFEEGLKIVHENNMTKVGPDGVVLRNPDGKVLKPAGYKKVDLSNLIKL